MCSLTYIKVTYTSMGMSRLLSQKHTVEMLSKQVNQPNVSSVLPQHAGVLLCRRMYMMFPLSAGGGMNCIRVSAGWLLRKK